ncbi:MAG: glycerophosphodiester phosphodiesterase [Planctomycetaceae bacterium]|nr:glycerophosphodiester phosphodiesterase [Planctomycetaceae bacterium]MCP4462414.1 glycerophosphodiester phosphodiesterase [Planctomycetaceae bacterium]MDG2104176.1 glycerophosphodiester phosphodiesterase [Pirellulaceae bacterium]
MLRQIAQDFRECWKPLLITSFLYKLLTIVFLAPLVALPLQLTIRFSSNQVLTDQDIAFFFATPLGAISLIAGIAIFISIAASELTALLAILASDRKNPSPLGAIRFAFQRKARTFKVTARGTLVLLLITAPFLLIAGLIYRSLLSEFDINFYLQQSPPEFKIAVGLGIVLLVTWLVLAFRLLVNWYLAIGLAAFCETNPSKKILQESRERVLGFRRRILFWVLIWLAASTLISTVSAGIIINIASIFIPALKDSITALAVAIGFCFALWSLVNLLTALFSQCLFAVVYFTLFRQMADDLAQKIPPTLTSGTESLSDGPGFQITGTRLMIGLVIGLLFAVAMGWSLAANLRVTDDVSIIAHRGASNEAPENTMAAIQQAIKDEADWVEIDVQETVDDHIIVFHDSDFMKLAKNPLKIWDATLADVEAIDIGSWFDPKFSDQRAPTLRDVLKACKGKIRVLIELKYYGHDVDLENRVAQIVEEEGMVDQIELMSLKLEAVTKMKKLRPTWRVGLLMSVATGNLKASEADFLAINGAFVDRDLIKKAHQRQQDVLVWTVNDAASMSTMIGMGVDGLITDKPALGRAVLRDREKLNVGQRLMLELADVFGIQPQITDQ